MSAAAQDDPTTGGVTRVPGGETAIFDLRDVLTANGVDAARLGDAKGTQITVPAAAELRAELHWHSSWSTSKGFINPHDGSFFDSTDDAAAALRECADRVLGTDELLLPIKEEMKSRPGDGAIAWRESRILRQISGGWVHQWRCRDCNRGQVDCHTCNRAGAVKCHYCNWNGYRTCGRCHGKGKIQVPGAGMYDYQNCPGCGGGGEEKCTICYSSGGPGKARCSTCNGTGTLNCRPCGATGGFTALGSVEFELRSTARTVLSRGCPPDAKGIADRPLMDLARAPGADVRLRRLSGGPGRMDAVLEFTVTLLEAEVRIKDEPEPAWTMVASKLGFVLHNRFLARLLRLDGRGERPPAERCEQVLRESRDTRVGAALLRLAVEKDLAKEKGDQEGTDALRGVLHERDRWFVGAGDLIPWRDALRHAYASIPAEVISRSWRKVLPYVLGLALLLPLVTSPYAPWDLRWGVPYEYWLKQGLVLLGCLFTVFVATQGVANVSLDRLREVVPEATAHPSQNDWPSNVKVWTFMVWLASTAGLYYLPWLFPPGAAPARPALAPPAPAGSPARPSPQPTAAARPSLNPELFSLPTSFPGSEVYPLHRFAWNENSSIPYRTQVLLEHLGLLRNVVLDGKDNAPTRDAVAHLERVVGGPEEAARQVERLYPEASSATPQQRQFLLARAALLGTLDFKEPPPGPILRYLPPLLRLRQGSDGVRIMQNLVDLGARGVTGVDLEGRPWMPGSVPSWNGGLPGSGNSVQIRVEAPPGGLRRDRAGCFQALLRIEYPAGQSAMPVETMKVCPEDMRRPG